MNRILILVTLILLNLGAISQINPSKIIQEATQKMNSGDTDGAITTLQEFLDSQPTHFGALSTLGIAHRTKKEYKESVKAFEKAVNAQPSNPRGKFNLGVAYALNGDLDNAFKVLIELKSTNSFNITNVGLSPAQSILSADSRYKELFPSPEEYADPFVEENVKIIHDLKGENPGDQFGWIARNIGDIDADGVNDLTTSAPFNNDKASSGGKVYTYSGKTGKLLWSYANADQNGQLGMSIEAGGDVNGDGIPDVVAGAPYVNKTFVFSGKNGDVIYEWVGKDSKGAFGRGVKGVGDVNRDGYGDILIGEPYQIWGSPLNSTKIESSGNVYLYSGKNGEVLQTWRGNRIGDGFGVAVAGKTINGNTLLIVGSPNAGKKNGGEVCVYNGMETKPSFVIESDSTGNGLGGMFLSVVGDVDGDNNHDVYASDWGNNALGNSTGRIYVHSGATGERLITLTGETVGDGFGIGIADAGDLNDDGSDDLVIGAWQHGSAAPSGGKIYLYSGKDSSLFGTITGKVVGETLGFDTTGLGDVNGDGTLDLLLTSAWSAINGTRSGRILIVSVK